MKVLLAAAMLLLSNTTDTPLLLLDIALKKPVQPAEAFTATQYLQRSFPIYATEAEAVIDAAEKVVRLIEKEPPCFRVDTVATPHSMFLLTTDCAGGQNFSVVLVTTLDESRQTYGFALVTNETNQRKAQQKVLDFATYLER